LNKKEIQELSPEKLLNAFYWLAVRTTHEVNSKRGLTKQTVKDEDLILNELASKFGINRDFLKDGIDR
jgi:hypothetical protein